MKSEKIYNGSKVYQTEPINLPLTSESNPESKSLCQPNMILDARYNYRLIQISAIVKITNILQPIICNNIEKYSSLLRQYQKSEALPKTDYLLSDNQELRVRTPDVFWDRKQQMLEVRLPMDAFTGTPSHYDRVFDAVKNMTAIPVMFPTCSNLTNKTLTDGQRPLCVGVYRAKDTKQKNRAYIHIFFQEDLARLMVNPCYGYSRLQQETIDNCRSLYTARIYMQICRHADGKKWAIKYEDLRILLNLDSPIKKGGVKGVEADIKKRVRTNTAPRFHEFRRRILDVARDELLQLVQKKQTNYYFTYTEEFPSNRHSTPSFIIFNIYEVCPSKPAFDAYDKALTSMRYYAREILHIGLTKCDKTFRDVTPRNYSYVFQRHLIVWEYILEHEARIHNPDAYYLKCIETAIREEKISHDQGVIQMELKL